jgi:uroporphyrinogen-III synthase
MSPPRVLSFESRRADEMHALISKFGGKATVAPSMKEVPLAANSAVLDFAQQFLGGEFDLLVLMTGVGTRYLLEVVEKEYDRERFLDQMRASTIALRGPKPAAVLREWNVPFAIRAPEPNTWRELLAAIKEAFPLEGKRVAVQEYGQSNLEFLAALREAGADVREVTVYRWELPDDRQPLEDSIHLVCARNFDILMFTSAQQVRHVLQLAEELQLEDAWRAAAAAMFVASIGPTCSEALEECGLHVNFEASPPKMGHLVRGALEQFAVRR